jgi:hypothetical protein
MDERLRNYLEIKAKFLALLDEISTEFAKSFSDFVFLFDPKARGRKRYQRAYAKRRFRKRRR